MCVCAPVCAHMCACVCLGPQQGDAASCHLQCLGSVVRALSSGWQAAQDSKPVLCRQKCQMVRIGGVPAWLPRARRLLRSGERSCEAHVGCCGSLFCFVSVWGDVMYFAYLRIHFPLDFHQLVKQYGSQVPAILKQEEYSLLQGRQKSLFYSGNMY